MESVGFFSSFSEAFSQGGIWMWAILAVQILATAIIIERVVYLYLVKKVGQKRLAHAFEADIKNGRLDAVQSRAHSIGQSNPITQIALAGSQAAKDLGGKEEIQVRIDEVLLDEKVALEKRTGFLAMLGNVGTLLGLLGTIVGLIQAFGSVAGLDPIEKAAALTSGISMAMYTTAYGLIMAIPTLFMYSVLQNRTNALLEDLGQGALRLYNWLSFRYDNVVPMNKKKA